MIDDPAIERSEGAMGSRLSAMSCASERLEISDGGSMPVSTIVIVVCFDTMLLKMAIATRVQVQKQSLLCSVQ